MATILIIEDDPSILNSYIFVLTQNGHIVDQASRANDALEIIEMKKYDLIIVDMLLPEMSGLDFLKTIKASIDLSKTKILALSNTESPKVIEEAKKLGASEYLLKVETTPNDLASKVTGLLNSDERKKTD